MPTYVFNLVELEILKTYLKTHQKTRVIWLSKFPEGVPFFFDKNLNSILIYISIIKTTIIS